MEPEENDDQPGDDAELGAIGLDELTENGSARAQRDEHRGEAEHEEDRRQHDAPPCAPVDPV